MGLGDLVFRKQAAVEGRMSDYLDHWKECIECFRLGMESYLERGPGEKLDYFYARVDREESNGDELRRAIERELYEKALLPEARGDILRTLEGLDLVINRCESTIRQLVIERLQTEPWMHEELVELLEATIEACTALHQAATFLLGGKDEPIPELIKRVDMFESRCDHLELDLLGRIFSSDLELARKLQLKDFVRRIGTIADFAESSSDIIHIVSIKRKV